MGEGQAEAKVALFSVVGERPLRYLCAKCPRDLLRTVATTGVPNPAISNSPAVAMKSWKKPVPTVDVYAENAMMLRATNEPPAATRSKRSPTPGQPRANVENKRRTPDSDHESPKALAKA